MDTHVSCTRCGRQLPGEIFNTGGLAQCPQCGARLQVEVFFPAFLRAPAAARTGERIAVEGESSCFYHPQKRAVVPCEVCGRFLCALCDVELDGRHLCPSCLESGKKKKTIQSLEDSRVLYNRQALVLSLIPFFITGIAAVYLALRYWKAPLSLVSPARWAMPTALVLGLLQTLGFICLILMAVAS